MKLTLLETLMDLFHHYLKENGKKLADLEQILGELRLASESGEQVIPPSNEPQLLHNQLGDNLNSYRIYSPNECARLSMESRGFIELIERLGIINAQLREQVINRAMAEKHCVMEVDDIKPIVINVLREQDSDDLQLNWIHHVMFSHGLECTKH